MPLGIGCRDRRSASGSACRIVLIEKLRYRAEGFFCRKNLCCMSDPLLHQLSPDRAFSTADIEAYDSRRKEIRSEHPIDRDAAVIDGQEALRSEVSASKHEFRHRAREGFGHGRPGAADRN